MSQPNAAYADLSRADQELSTQTQLDHLFNTVDYGQITYDQIASEAGVDFGLQHYYTPPESASATPAPAPITDFFDYNFGQLPTRYPTPRPNTPHPYPLEQQQCVDQAQNVNRSFRQRPHTVRSQTNTSYLQPLHLSLEYTRRRSLSQSAIDHSTTHKSQAPNPVFMRLQTPRARSETSGSHVPKRRARHTRSISQDASSRGHGTRDNAPTSTPHYVNGLVPTRIGDPILPEQQWPVPDGYADEIVFRQMRPKQMERSKKIIEIGAIAVGKHVDPALERSAAAMLKKVEEVERYLRAECGECDGALRGCATIREALARKKDVLLGQEGVSVTQKSPIIADAIHAPGKVMSGSVDDLFGEGDNSADQDALVDVLMQENAAPLSNNSV